MTPVDRLLAKRDWPCEKCGYNLRGMRGGACPECGTKLNLRDLRRRLAEDPWVRKWSWRSQWAFRLWWVPPLFHSCVFAWYLAVERSSTEFPFIALFLFLTLHVGLFGWKQRYEIGSAKDAASRRMAILYFWMYVCIWSFFLFFYWIMRLATLGI